MFSQDETNVQKLRDLCLRWNKAASDAGFTGSEYIDDPERVFQRATESRSVLMGLIHRYATTPYTAGKDPAAATEKQQARAIQAESNLGVCDVKMKPLRLLSFLPMCLAYVIC